MCQVEYINSKKKKISKNLYNISRKKICFDYNRIMNVLMAGAMEEYVRVRIYFPRKIFVCTV